MKMRITLMLTFLMPIALLFGCRTTAPQDLRFESVDRVKLSEMPGVWNAVQSRSNARSDAVTLLKINFSSKFDFVKLAKAETLHVSYRAFTCVSNNAQGSAWFVLPDLRIKDFSAGGGVYSAVPDLEQFRDSNGRFTYHVLIPIAGEELTRIFGNGTAPGQTPYFNPSATHDDICLQVIAAAMWFGATFQSNVVRVPAEEVSRLIN